VSIKNIWSNSTWTSQLDPWPLFKIIHLLTAVSSVFMNTPRLPMAITHCILLKNTLKSLPWHQP